MGKIVTVKNPRGKKITFSEDDHKYFDEKGNQYRSATTIVHSLFPEFKQDMMAYVCGRKRLMKEKGYATKEQVPVPECMEMKKVMLAEWEANRIESCDRGTAVHRFAECKLLNIDFDGDLNQPKSEKMVKVVGPFVEELLEQYDLIETEKIVFCPKLLLAGTVDLIMQNKKTKKLCIFDWKTNKAMNLKDSYNQKGLLFLKHIENCNYWHYVIQLNIYRWILTKEKYGDYEDVEMGLFHINTRKVKAYQIPKLDYEIEQVMDYTKRLKGTTKFLKK